MEDCSIVELLLVLPDGAKRADLVRLFLDPSSHPISCPVDFAVLVDLPVTRPDWAVVGGPNVELDSPSARTKCKDRLCARAQVAIVCVIDWMGALE